MTFTSSRFQQLPADKGNVDTKLLQYRLLTNIITAEDNPNKNRAHVRMALEKSTLLAAKSHDMASTMGLAYSTAETDAMDEYEYLLPVRVRPHHSHAGTSSSDRGYQAASKANQL